MSGLVIFFSVVLGAATMGVGSQVMVFSGYLLRFVHIHSRCTRGAVRSAGADKGRVPEGWCGSSPQKCRIYLQHADSTA